MLEREKTYLLHSFPDDLHHYTMQRLIDIYIPLRNWMAQLRARKKDKIYEFTKKFPLQKWNNSLQTENTILIDEDEFDYLFTYLPCILQKKRYSYSPQKWILYDIDVFEWNLSWLLMIDVEFADESAMKDFVVPAFFGKELTQDKRFAWGVLAQMKRYDVEKLLKEIY